MTGRIPTPGRRTRRLAFAGAAVIGVLALGEVVARLVLPVHPLARAFQREASQSWVLPRSGELEMHRLVAHTNRHGYRGPEVALARRPCTLRVYVAGDSSVFGDNVADDKTFSAQLQRALRRRLAPPLGAEVINGGVPGYSTYQSLLRLEQSGWAFSPDLLVVASLWSDSAPAATPDRVFFAASPTIPPAVAQPLFRWLGRSWLWARGLVAVTRSRFVYDPGAPPGKAMRVPLPEYRANLRRMAGDAARRGARTLFLVLPHPVDQVHTGGPDVRRMRRDVRSRGHGEIAHDYRGAMRAAARDTDSLLVDMPRRVTAVRDRLFVDELHPNARGHRLIAEAILEAVTADARLLRAVAGRCDAWDGRSVRLRRRNPIRVNQRSTLADCQLSTINCQHIGRARAVRTAPGRPVGRLVSRSPVL